MSGSESLEQAVCARCGAAIDPSDHFLITQAGGPGHAFFCRTEHIVAWVMRGATWQFERPWEVGEDQRSAVAQVQLERSRSGEKIERTFDSAEDLRAWASGGGFWSEE